MIKYTLRATPKSPRDVLETRPSIPYREAQLFKQQFRKLLREASYLPDPYARTYFKQHIISRFKAYNKPHLKPQHSSTILNRIPSLTADCARTLHMLQCANQAYPDYLLKVLLHTYGRRGRRRWELLQPWFVHGEDSSEYQDIISSKLELHQNVPESVSDSLPRLTPALEALVAVQRKARPSRVLGKSNKIIFPNGPEIPLQNIWREPTSAARVKKKIKQYRGAQRARLLPPLPDAELEYVKQLAFAEKPWAGPVARRALAKTQSSDSDAESLLDIAIPCPRHRVKGQKERPHSFTQRFMRRLYMQLFLLCPELEQSADKTSWIARWPKSPSLFSKLGTQTRKHVVITNRDKESPIPKNQNPTFK